MHYDYEAVAYQNLQALATNPYPGRGIILGVDKSGWYLIQVYWIMGRSENSRNRVFTADGGRVFTEAADPAKVKDPKLIIYNAMNEIGGSFIVSNGDQTDTLISKLKFGERFDDILETRMYEPDSPNFTPRISGLSLTDRNSPTIAELSIIRKSAWSVSSDRFLYRYESIAPGFGFCVTTYTADDDPLPSFRGEPLLMPLYGDIEDIASTYWRALNEDNRVSLAVKFISTSTRSMVYLVNKYRKTAP